MGKLIITLLGGLTIRVDGRLITGFKSRKAEAVLVYLACHPRPQTRDHLADLLWEGSDPNQAGANLRKTLSDLRQNLGDFLLINRDEISLNPNSDWWLDAAAFQQLLTPPKNNNWRDLEQALTFYQGDFLAGFFLRENRGFDEWASLERERLRLLALSALSQLVTDCLHRRRYDLGVTQATRWLNLDPFNETAHRLMMRLYARRGQRNLALIQFTTCQHILAEELGVKPTAITLALADRVRFAPQQPLFVPPIFTPLIGRGKELTQMSHALETGRLVTITGVSGSGKTRLAAEVATIHTSDFRHGVCLISAATGDWVATVSQALVLPELGTINQLALALRGRELLLILDDWLSSPETLSFVTGLLQQTDALKFIVITHQPTGLPGEQVLSLAGLSYPPPNSDADIALFPAGQLFLQQARRVRLDFALTAENEKDVRRICQLVAGLPRELELAAATIRAFTPRQIAAQLAENQASPTHTTEPARTIRTLWNDARLFADDSQAQLADQSSALFHTTNQPQAALTIRLLGGFQLIWQGQPLIGFKSRKAEALCAYLVCQPRPHARETLATMFWDESSQEQALANLRKVLTELPTPFVDYLLIARQTITFNTEKPYWLDAAAFQQLLSSGDSTLAALEVAISLYQGAFLAGFHLPDSPEFESWAALERERWHHQFSQALHTLAQTCLHRRHYAPGLVYAHRLQRVEPLSERAQRLVMLLLARQGHSAEALRQYQQFQALLFTQLGITPTAETQALAERIQTISAQPDRLPTPAVHFVGREQELSLLGHWLDDPDCRLLTITGPGGVGKTTLALIAAADRQVDYLHGVIFVSLVGVANLDELIPTLAAALGFSFSGAHPPRQQLLNYLRQKELLLVLDNSETLTSPALAGSLDLLLDILQQAPQVKILATSRDRFNVAAEQVCPLLGLPLPSPQAEFADIVANEVVQLFTLRAVAKQTTFALTSETAPDVVAICRLVQGVPLGVELAAAAVAFYPVQRIAEEIRRNLDFLVHHTPEQADRHRSLRAVFSYSWQLLTEREQEIFRQLSVFRGLFSLEAAQAVVGATRQDILWLIDKTIVRSEPGERYQVHELLRQYGAEKLADVPGAAATAQKHHSRYYTQLLKQQEPALFGREIKQAAHYLEGQIDNIRAAWRWAVAKKDGKALAAAALGLSRYCLLRGLFQEGERLFSAAAEALLIQPDLRLLRNLMLCEQARFLNEQALYDQAIQVAQQAALDNQSAVVVNDSVLDPRFTLLTTNAHLELGRALWRQGAHAAARQQADQVIQQAQAEGLFLLQAEGLRLQAGIHVELGQVDEGKPLFEAALDIYQKAGDLLNESTVLHNLGLMMRRMGEFTAAQQYYEQAITAREAIGYRQGMALTYNNLGALLNDQGDVRRAIAYTQQALSISRQIGDRYVEGMALINLGINHHDQGIYEAARQYYTQSLALCQETGNRRLEGLTRQMAALLLCHLGEYAAALQACDQLMALAEAISDPAMVNYAWLCRGHSLIGLKEWGVAHSAYEQALAGWEGELLIFQMEPRTGLARTGLLQGNIQQARQAIEPVLAFLAAENSLDGLYEPLQVYLICYEVLRASGEGERGRGILNTAYAILQERAAKISDESMRHSFLTNVPTHRNLMTAYEKERTAYSPSP